MKTQTKTQRASGLIFAVVLLFVILGMVVTLSSVTMLETKMNQKTKSSVGAFYNSESGVEWALNQIATKSGTAYISSIGTVDGNSIKCPDTFGTNVCKIMFLDKDGKVLATSSTIDQVKAVRSVGTQSGDTQRAIEAAVAAGLNCVSKADPIGSASGGDDAQSIVSCDSGYTLTGCSCFSPWNLCEGATTDLTSNKCIAWNNGLNQGAASCYQVYAQAVCCK